MSKDKTTGLLSSLRRNLLLNESGNVFFTLFGAVAVVGVLGAGIMATMRGPLKTMVEVNRREQAKAELRVASNLILVASAGDTCGDADGITEGVAPTASGTFPTNGGVIPASVSANKTDPWGNAYGYCAWDHGASAGVDDVGCGTVLAGSTDTNNIAIAVMSAGPDGQFDTTCEDDNSGTNDYVEPDQGGNDDIVVTLTYNQAVAGSGGLWSIKSGTPTTAEIDKDLEVTGTGTSSFAGDISLAASASMITDTIDPIDPVNRSYVSIGDGTLRGIQIGDVGAGQCAAAGDAGIMRINGGNLEICNGTSFESAGGLWTSLSATRIHFGSAGTEQVGIGMNNPNDTLDVAGTVDISSTLNVTSDTTLGGNLAVNTNMFTVNAANGNTLIAGTLTGNGDATITGDTDDGSTDVLQLNDSGTSEIFAVNSNGDTDIAGSLDVGSDTIITSSTDDGSTNVLDLKDSGNNTVFAVDSDGGVTLSGKFTPSITITSDVNDGSGTPLRVENSDNTAALTVADDGDTVITGDLTISGDDLVMGTNTDTAILVADGSNFNPVVPSGDVSITNAGVITLDNDVVDQNELVASGTASDGLCLKASTGSALKWEACSGGGGGDGVGSDGFTDLSDTPGAYAGAAADANKVVVVNGTGDGLVFVDADSLDSAGKWSDATEANDIKYNVDADNDVLIGADSSAAVSLNANASQDLHVAGIIQTASRIYNAAGAEATPSYSFTSDPNSGIYSGGADILGLVTGGTSRINLLANGDVGVGTTSVATGVGGDGQDLLMEVNGALGATYYCDVDGEDCFVASDVGTGIWTPDGTNDYIEYDDTLGGVRIGKISGQPAPETDWTLDVGNSVVYTTNGVAIGSSTLSSGEEDLELDVTGDIGATNYCDADGDDCFTAAEFAALAGGAEVNNLESQGAADIADTEIFIGTGAGTGNYAALSGDVTMLNTGAVSIANNAIDTVMLNDAVDPGVGQDGYCLTYDHNGGTPRFEWIDCATAAGSGAALDDITAADGAATINSGDNAIIWNWATTTAGKDAFTFGENTASTATGESSILKATTLATSTATPLMVTNLGAANSFRVNDETGDNDATPFIIDADGKVGAGTPTPASQMHVYNGGSDGVMLLEGPESGNTLLALTTSGDAASLHDGDTTHWNIVARGAANTLYANAQRNDLIIEYWNGAAWAYHQYFDQSTGNVGFGTALGSLPSASLDVEGTDFLLPAPASAVADGSFANSQWSLWLDEASDEFELKAKKSDGSIITQTVGSGGGTPGGADTQVQYNDGGAFAGDAGFVYAAGTDTLTIGSTINVGDLINIGSTTGAAAPTGVSVSTTIAANAIEESMLKAVDTANDEECLTFETTTGDFEWQACGGGSSDRIEDSGDQNTYIDVDTNDADGNNTISMATAGTERVHIQADGDVGIGTATPSGNLHIYDNAGDAWIFIEAREQDDSGFVLGTSGDAASFADADTSHWNFTARGVSHSNVAEREDLLIEYWDGSSWNNDYFFMEHDTGNLGLGTDTPSARLDVIGDIEYTGTITDVSDRRLKDNITPLTARGSMIEKIDSIDTYSFTMKDDADKRTEFGVMAQELEAIFPELVHTASDEMGTKSVNYVGLIGPMIEATKEVHAENQMLKAELAEIKAQVELLNKATADKAGKASALPTDINTWLYILLGMLGTACIVLVMNRKPAKAE